MDWLSIGVIVLVIVLLIVFQNLTNAGTRPCCQMKPLSAQGKQLKSERSIQEENTECAKRTEKEKL